MFFDQNEHHRFLLFPSSPTAPPLPYKFSYLIFVGETHISIALPA